MGDGTTVTAIGPGIDPAAGGGRSRHLPVPPPHAGRAAAWAGRRGGQVGAERDDIPVVAAALGGLFLTCSALRARYRERIRALEGEIVRLSHAAERDPLTGLGNRRAFERCLSVESRRASRHGSHLTLALVDVDHFKLYNDSYGHPAGDRALQRVARCLAQALERPADGVFRIGGEEFALVLPDTDGAGARVIGDRVCAALRAAALPHGRSASGILTMSFGSCSTIVRDDREVGEVLSAADRALYGAKDAGRDRALCMRRRSSLHGGAAVEEAVTCGPSRDRPAWPGQASAVRAV